MNILFPALAKELTLNNITKCFNQQLGQSYIYGLAGSQKHTIVAAAYQENPKTTIIITKAQENIEDWYSDLSVLLPDTNILELPALDVMSVTATAKSLELKARRMKVLGLLTRKEPAIILVSANAAMQKDMSKQDFENASIQLEINKIYDYDKILEQLVSLGYEHTDKIEQIGQFCARGGIIDVYPINSDTPIRIEFFDNEIESIREFDIDSQCSLNNIAKCEILPLIQMDNNGVSSIFLAYLHKDCNVILDEPLHLKETITGSIKENPEIKEFVYEWNYILAAAKKHNLMYVSLMMQRIPDTEPKSLISVAVKSTAPFQKQMHLLGEEIKNWLEQQNEILILSLIHI